MQEELVTPKKEVAMTLDDLSPELREKALACKTPEDLIELAKEEGIDLSDDQLQAISGGFE